MATGREHVVRRYPGLRAHLTGLVLAVLIPSLALGGATAWHMGKTYRASFEEQLSDTARALTFAVDAEIGAHVAALRALAASPDLDPGGSLENFRRIAEPALGQFGSWMVVTDREGRTQLANTLLPHSALLPRRDGAPAPMVEQALATQEPVVINLHRAPLAQRLVAAVVVPVVRNGEVIRLLAAPVLPERLSEILSAQPIGGFATLIDGLGRVVARSSEQARYLGSPAPGWFEAISAGRDRGLALGPALDGQHALVAFHRLKLAPAWTLAVGVPWGAYQASWLNPLLLLGAGSVVAFALALGLAAWLGSRMLHPLRALVRRADALAAAGDVSPRRDVPGAVRVAEFEALRLAGERAEHALQRTAAELRESEARFRAVFDSGLLGLTVFDAATGRTLAINDRALELMDTSRAEFESDVRGWREATAPDHLPRDEALVREIIGSGTGHPIEKDYIRKDGSRTPVRLSVAPLPGQPGRVVIGVEDLAERRAAENALRESEERFRLIAESAPVMLWMGDQAGHCVYLNRALRDFWGVEPEAVGAFDWGTTLHSEDLPALAETFGRGMREQTGFTVEARYRNASGEFRTLATRALPRFGADGAFLGMIGVNVDVTEAHQAQAALEDGNERLRLALETAELGAWEIDLRTQQARRSARTLEIFGSGPDSETGPYPAWRDAIHPDDRAQLAAEIESVTRGEAECYHVEYRFRRPDGAWRWIESHAKAVERDPRTGRALRLIGTTRDVTGRKEAEELQTLLMREVDHRARNSLAVVQAALRLTPKDDTKAYSEAVVGRVAALARAHTILSEGKWSGAALESVAEAELAAFTPVGGTAEMRPTTGRVHLAGPDVWLRPAAVQAISMALHELATNATKYGALSVPDGRLRLDWRVEHDAGRLVFRWQESGGPPLSAPPLRRGFGTRIVAAVIRDQLGGTVERDWAASGLGCTITLPLARIARMEEGPDAHRASHAAAERSSAIV